MTVTEISISESGYMEVEDKDEMQEQVVREQVVRQVPKNPVAVRPGVKPQVKAAPSGQRSLADMFRKK